MAIAIAAMDSAQRGSASTALVLRSRDSPLLADCNSTFTFERLRRRFTQHIKEIGHIIARHYRLLVVRIRIEPLPQQSTPPILVDDTLSEQAAEHHPHPNIE